MPKSIPKPTALPADFEVPPGCGPMSRDEERTLARRVRAGDRSARNLFALRNLRFVLSETRKMRAYSAADSLGAGFVGLMVAIDSFDPERGTRFGTHAARCIRREVIRGMQADRLIAIPEEVFEAARDQAAGRPIPGVLRGRVADARAVLSATVAGAAGLDRCPGPDDPGREPPPALLDELLAGLDDRQLRVVAVRHGLDGSGEGTEGDAAAAAGVTGNEARNLYRGAMAKLKRRAREMEMDACPVR